MTRSQKSIDAIKKTIKGYQNGDLELLILKPKNIAANAAALVYYHGGGFLLTASGSHKKSAGEYALKANCIVIFPLYRLPAQQRFPTSLEDSYAALLWTQENATALGINPHRIAVGGDSAGGALAACVSQMAVDRKMVNVCFQMLIYPVLDNTMSSDSMKQFQDTPVWNAVHNQTMWRIYLQGCNTTPPYAAALQRENLAGLPPTYIETAEFDCLRDEGILYAQKLKKEGIAVELNETKGTIHGYDTITKSAITKNSFERRFAALNYCFNI